jgi:RNA recognition motif-containing protein
LFIGNLNDGTNENDVREIFQEFGAIKEVRFLFERGTGRFRGCGFVEFEDERATIDAVRMHGAVVRGRPIRVDFSNGSKRN